MDKICCHNPACKTAIQEMRLVKTPPNKRTRVDSEEADSEGETDLKEGEEPHGPLVNGEVTVLDNF